MLEVSEKKKAACMFTNLDDATATPHFRNAGIVQIPRKL
jgi:hypothetical protein